MHIFIGSTNPVKINAVINAASETWPELKAKGFSVASGVSDQPRTDEETRQGAITRAKNVLAKGKKSMKKQSKKDALMLGVGLEGGVFQKGDELWSTVWAAVVDENSNLFTANGARFKVPTMIAQPILAGEEMGPVVSKLCGKDDVKKKNGAIGVVTKNFIDRTEEYTGIVKLALGLWYGKDWEKTLY